MANVVEAIVQFFTGPPPPPPPPKRSLRTKAADALKKIEVPKVSVSEKDLGIGVAAAIVGVAIARRVFGKKSGGGGGGAGAKKKSAASPAKRPVAASPAARAPAAPSPDAKKASPPKPAKALSLFRRDAEAAVADVAPAADAAKDKVKSLGASFKRALSTKKAAGADAADTVGARLARVLSGKRTSEA